MPIATALPARVARAAVATAVALVVAVASPAASSAQSTLRTALDTTRVTVGDRLTLQVQVRHASDAAVSWPDSVDVAPFEVLEARIQPTRTVDGESVSTAVYSLAAFELGELELPSFDVTVLHAEGREEVLETDRYGVEVMSVGVEEGSDIREIRGPLTIPIGALTLLAWALALMLLGAAAYAAMRRFRAGDDDEAIRPGPAPRPPHEVALEELDRLEASQLLARGEVKEFHIRVSEILRRYVEERFRVPALEMTTWEVLGGLQSIGVDEELRVELRRFLDQCDLVKFAKAEPGEDESRQVLELGRELVRRSTPTAPPPEAFAGAAAPPGEPATPPTETTTPPAETTTSSETA